MRCLSDSVWVYYCVVVQVAPADYRVHGEYTIFGAPRAADEKGRGDDFGC